MNCSGPARLNVKTTTAQTRSGPCFHTQSQQIKRASLGTGAMALLTLVHLLLVDLYGQSKETN